MPEPQGVVTNETPTGSVAPHRFQKPEPRRQVSVGGAGLPKMLLLNAEVGKNLGLGFVDGKQVVAGGAVLSDAFSVLCHMVAVVAAEATRIAHVTNVVWVRSPCHLHIREHVLAVERDQFLARGLDQRRL